MLARICQSIPGGDCTTLFQVALVAHHDFGRRRQTNPGARAVGSEFLAQPFILLHALFRLLVDLVHEIVQRLQARGIGNVVDQQKAIGLSGGFRPEAPIFLLSRRIGDGQKVREAIDGARDRVRVL